MKRIVSLLICCFVLCSFDIPASAKTEIGFNEQWQRTFDYSLYAALPTSLGDLLAISFTADEDQLLFDFYKLDRKNGKIIKKVLLKSGNVFPFKAKAGQAYLLFYDAAAKKLILYDENLTILWSLEKDSYSSSFEEIVYWEIVEEQFLFYNNESLEPILGFTKSGEELSFPPAKYERPVLTPCAGEAFCPEAATVDIHIQDNTRNIDRTVTVKPNFPANHIVNFVSVFVYEWERYLNIASYQKIDFTKPDRYMMYINSVDQTDETKMTHRFIEFNAQGEIVREIEFAQNELEYDFFSTGNRFAFIHDQQYMLLNLDTMQMNTVPLDSKAAYSSSYEYPSYLMTDESFYLFQEGYSLGQKFARTEQKQDLLTILKDYVLLHSFDQHTPSLAYHPVTGERVGELKQATNFMDVQETGNIVAHSPNFEKYSYTLTMIQPEPMKSYAKNKSWTISFNQAVDPRSINDHTVYVLDAKGEHVEGVTFTVDQKKVSVHAPAKGYLSGESYTLVITKKIKAANGRPMTSGQTKKFKIK